MTTVTREQLEGIEWAAEWIDADGNATGMCPECRSIRTEWHHPSCWIAAALAPQPIMTEKQAPPAPPASHCDVCRTATHCDYHSRCLAECIALAPPATPTAMPPVEVGDWVTDEDEPDLVDVVADADDIAMWTRPDARASILEIRKANGHVWTREPRP